MIGSFQTNKTTAILFLFISVFVFIGCRNSSEPTMTNVSKNDHTEISLVTPQGTATDMPVPSPTKFIPAPTFTPIPTITPYIPPTPTPDLRVFLNEIDDFAENRNMLTGELVTDASVLQRRPIAVKISNAPAKFTRPQSGLSQADLVFEHITEGSITRFTAIFYGHTPDKIGPIRSARLIDLEIPVMYDAALAYSGSSIGVSRKLFHSEFSPRILRSNVNGYFRTGENKPYEHTLYAYPEDLWAALSERDLNRRPIYWSVISFSSEPPPSGKKADAVNVTYSRFSSIDWKYDGDLGKYLRWVDGVEHTDANTGNQIYASNVALLRVPHQLDTSICEHQNGSQCLAYSMEILLSGQGLAYLLRDGLVYEVFWLRHTPSEMITFSNSQGNRVPLQIGNTWFQILTVDDAEAITFVDE